MLGENMESFESVNTPPEFVQPSGHLDKHAIYIAQQYIESLETDLDVQWLLTGKPMFSEQLAWLLHIKKTLNILWKQRHEEGGKSLNYTSQKTRLRNQEASLDEIFKKLSQHLSLHTVQDGDERCRAVKRSAMEELPHAIGMLAAEGYTLYYHHAVTAWQGLNRELYKQLDRISIFGDATSDTINTFIRALSYVVMVYYRAYSIPQDEEREKFFRKALENLVASYPLYLDREELAPQSGQDPIII
jgi:hypothetical protein